MRARLGGLMAVVFVLATLVWGIAAQSERGSLAGTVRDASGTVMPGVTVEASGPLVVSVVTDTRGAFRINNLIPGEYTVTATRPGFVVSTTRTSVTARVVARLAVELRVGSVAETAKIEGRHEGR